jgi:hypothetical protein
VRAPRKFCVKEAKEGNWFSWNKLLEILFLKERNLAKIYLEAFQDFTRLTKGEVHGFEAMKEGKKDKKKR